MRLPRPNHATLVAYLALFVALGGSSYAAVKLANNSVRSKHIKNGEVKRADIARNAVDSRRIADSSLRAADFAPGQLLQGPRGEQGPPGPVDGFTKAESDARYLGVATVQAFRMAPEWSTSSAGATTAPGPTRTVFSRTTTGDVNAVMPMSLPVQLGNRRVRPTAARVCFAQSSTGSTINGASVLIGSGNSPADDAEGQTLSVSDPSGCLTIDIAGILAGRNIGPDLSLALAINTTMGAGSHFVQFGPADYTLTPDPG